MEELLDLRLPRPLSAVADPTVVVAIDCPPGSVPGAVEWRLRHTGFDERLSAELRERAERLARELGS
nr:hypothetical protein GCM10020093_031720 [Planobispora longispora]